MPNSNTTTVYSPVQHVQDLSQRWTRPKLTNHKPNSDLQLQVTQLVIGNKKKKVLPSSLQSLYGNNCEWVSLLYAYSVDPYGKSYMVTIANHKCYIYVAVEPCFTDDILSCDFKQAIEDHCRDNIHGYITNSIDSVEYSHCKSIYNRYKEGASQVNNDIILAKVVLNNTIHYRDIIKLLINGCLRGLPQPYRSTRFYPYETDIDIQTMTKHDIGIRDYSHISISGNNYILVPESHRNTHMSVEVGCSLSSIVVLDDKDMYNYPMRVVSLDIQCAQLGDMARKCDTINTMIHCIACSYTELFKEDTVTTTVVFVQNGVDTSLVKQNFNDDTAVVVLQNERQLLESFRYFMILYDPDIIMGYNVTNYHIHKIVSRMKHNGMTDTIRSLARLKKSEFKYTPFNYTTKAKGTISFTLHEIEGRQQFDILTVYRNDMRMSFTLNYLSRHYLAKDIPRVSIKQLTTSSLINVSDNTFVVCCSIQRSLCSLQLNGKHRLISAKMQLAALSGRSLQEIVVYGTQKMVSGLLYYCLNCKDNRGLKIPSVATRKLSMKFSSNSVTKGAKSQAKYKGGFVLTPKTSYVANAIVIDLNSIYPNVIRRYNISPDTYVGHISDMSIKLDDDIHYVSPCGHIFFKAGYYQGFLGTAMQSFLDPRDVYKKLMKSVGKDDPLKWGLYNLRQLALKIAANSSYGGLANDYGNFHQPHCAETITSIARSILKDSIDHLAKLGYSTVYGDTDSLMIQSKEDTDMTLQQQASEIVSSLNKDLYGESVICMKLEYICDMLLLQKKEYVCYVHPSADDDEWAIKHSGTVCAKMGNCSFVQENYHKVVKTILDTRAKEELTSDCSEKVFGIVKGALAKLSKGIYTSHDLIQTNTINAYEPNKNPASKQAHAHMQMERDYPGAAYPLNTKMPYLIAEATDTRTHNKPVQRSYEPMYMVRNKLHVDLQMYANILRDSLKRVFVAAGISSVPPNLFEISNYSTTLVDIEDMHDIVTTKNQRCASCQYNTNTTYDCQNSFCDVPYA